MNTDVFTMRVIEVAMTCRMADAAEIPSMPMLLPGGCSLRPKKTPIAERGQQGYIFCGAPHTTHLIPARQL